MRRQAKRRSREPVRLRRLATARRISCSAIATGSRKSPGRQPRLKKRRRRADGIEPLIFDGASANPGIARALTGADALLVSIPPDAEGDPTLRYFAEAIAAAPRLAWIGYLSTVGVYGDHGGGFVDEDTPPQPLGARSRRRLEAEEAWLDLGARRRQARPRLPPRRHLRPRPQRARAARREHGGDVSSTWMQVEHLARLDDPPQPCPAASCASALRPGP